MNQVMPVAELALLATSSRALTLSCLMLRRWIFSFSVLPLTFALRSLASLRNWMSTLDQERGLGRVREWAEWVE